MAKGNLVKARGAIHVSYGLSLAEQKTWNYLLKNAYSDLTTQSAFMLSFHELRSFLNTNDSKAVRKSLRNLQVPVKFNFFNKDRSDKWGNFFLLSHANIKNGIIHYSFSEELSRLLVRPKYYALVNMAVMQNITSKYSLRLYEFCVDYQNFKQRRTGWCSIESFRTFMGVSDDKYPEFKQFNKCVLKRAVEEVNAVSNLEISIELKRNGRCVTALQFKVKNRPFIPEKPNNSQHYFIPARSAKGEVDRLLSYGMSLGVEELCIRNGIKKHGVLKVQKKLDVMQKSDLRSIRNKTGWFFKSLEKDFTLEGEEREYLQQQSRNKESLWWNEQKLHEKYKQFQKDTVKQQYNLLPISKKLSLDAAIAEKIKYIKKTNLFARQLSDETLYEGVLAEHFLVKEDWSFEVWKKHYKNETDQL